MIPLGNEQEWVEICRVRRWNEEGQLFAVDGDPSNPTRDT